MTWPTPSTASIMLSPVLQAESEPIRLARLRLVAAARQTLANALHLLSIAAPQVM